MKRVLVVDDAAFMRMALKTILEKCGFEVVGEADTGIKAVQQYKVLKPDIVTMDLTMPELGGVEAIKIIKTIDKNARIIVISSMGHEIQVKEAIMAGAVSFIVKPFKEEIVTKQLMNISETISK
ncbi:MULTISPECIES: response regulator [unclassified Clostridium]|uniref:response regulator n=1 Tax=unclassified Clostridium TaxID=2614128 RepID=UPI0002982284|nr:MULTISPECIES: response regulator [unclassified Clostridium]EKQ50377.1 MAG: response regulator (CheY-like and AraC-type DNA-binding domain containing protein) [Clostridium sp. Maddingley MBC34-26]